MNKKIYKNQDTTVETGQIYVHNKIYRESTMDFIDFFLIFDDDCLNYL